MRKNLSVNQFSSRSEEETVKIAQAFAKDITQGEVIALYGELGAGKTFFVRAVAGALGINGITSPTFILQRSYPLPGRNNANLNHLDLYRLDNAEDLRSLDFSEIIKNPNDITFIEWAEKAESLLPQKRINIRFSYAGENQRLITIENKTSKGIFTKGKSKSAPK